MRPFDLEKALAGEPVVTRDGKKVTEIFLLKTVTARQNNLLAVVDGDWYIFFRNGALEPGLSCNGDLFMAPVKMQERVRVFRCKGGESYYCATRSVKGTPYELDKLHISDEAELVGEVLIREWEE